jgi:carboxypeptidase C (cathepsin A)
MYGQFELHGPYLAVKEVCGNVRAKINPHAWTKKFNIIYVDNPVGAGEDSNTVEAA